MKDFQLGEFEEIVLLTVAILFGDAYGVTLKAEIESRLNRKVSIGALQSALRRMEEKGYLNSEFGEATAMRGGKRKRFFTVTDLGKKHWLLAGTHAISSGMPSPMWPLK